MINWTNIKPLIQLMKKGNKIKIKKENIGSFGRYCGGNVTEECIRRGKNSPNPRIRKKAIFAQNARGWSKKKHKNGGVINTTIVKNLF